MTIGTLYGVGVGPGDPELLTFRAARVLREAAVVFAPTQARSGRSVALEIARPHLPRGAEVVSVAFTHTFDGVESRDAHRQAAREVVAVLRRPASAAFLTLGDPMTYSTFTYVLEAVRELEPAAPAVVVPGITSYAAAAAESLEPLAEGDGSFAVVSASRELAPVQRALDAVDRVVVMKPYRNSRAVCDLLDRRGLEDDTVLAADVSRPGARSVRGTAAARRLGSRYLSLFLVRTRRSGR